MTAAARERLGALTGDQVTALDSAAAGAGVDVLQLMEIAGWQVARCAWLMLRRRPGRVAVVAGRGNNGGDGLVAARHLVAWGCRVEAVVLGSEERLRGLVPRHLATARAVGADVTVTDSADRVAAAAAAAALAVDAVLGTGLSSAPREPEAAAIEALGTARSVLSVDVPSGLHAGTGEPFEPCVRATVTCTLAAMKAGLWADAAAPVRGRVVVADIGMPPQAWAAAGVAAPPAVRGGRLIRVSLPA